MQLALVAQLAASCAPHVAVETLAAVAHTESGLDPLAMRDNATGRVFHPATREDAIARATALIEVERHSVDLGLMQINNANLASLGMTVTDAFDPCRSMAGADRVLVQGYSPPAERSDQQRALQQALSRYNTGDPARGVANGYVDRVQDSAEVIVPAIRLRGEADVTPMPTPTPASGPRHSLPSSGNWQTGRVATCNAGTAKVERAGTTGNAIILFWTRPGARRCPSARYRAAPAGISSARP